MKYYRLIAKYMGEYMQDPLYFDDSITIDNVLENYFNSFPRRGTYLYYEETKRKGNISYYSIKFKTLRGNILKTPETISIKECSMEEYVENKFL